MSISTTTMKVAYIYAPKACDMRPCARPAEFDVPTWRGPWANLCADHFETEAADGAQRIGSRLVVGEKPEQSHAEKRRDLMAAIEAGDFDLAEDIIGDGDIAEFL